MIKLLSKLVKKNKRDWHEKLRYLLAYCTLCKPPPMPYHFLWCMTQTVLPLEIQMPSLRTTLALEMTIKDNLQELEPLNERRLHAK